MMELKFELRELEQKEIVLDLQKFWIEQSIKNTTEDYTKYPFSRYTMQSVQEFVFSLKCFTFSCFSHRIRTENIIQACSFL